jgi:pimeloyl-ACP methyl ester carboxylesterase
LQKDDFMAKLEIKLDDKKIVYNKEGDGETVVLLHGFGENSNVWKNQQPALASYQLIIPDLPGTGPSEMISDMSMEGLAEVVKRILEVENINKCILIGHSMGGYIALAFAEKYPGMLTGLGLFHSTALADTEEKINARKKGIQFIKDNGAYPFLKNMIPGLYSEESKQSKTYLIDQHLEESKSFSKEALITYYESMIKRPERTNVLKTSTVPVLFIAGKDDVAVPLDDILTQSHLAEVSFIYILEQSGHMGMAEEIEKANQILVTFIAACENQLFK